MINNSVNIIAEKIKLISNYFTCMHELTVSSVCCCLKASFIWFSTRICRSSVPSILLMLFRPCTQFLTLEITVVLRSRASFGCHIESSESTGYNTGTSFLSLLGMDEIKNICVCFQLYKRELKVTSGYQEETPNQSHVYCMTRLVSIRSRVSNCQCIFFQQ